MNEAARERLADQTGQKDIKKIKKSNISYKSYEKFPKEAEVDKLQIYVGELARKLIRFDSRTYLIRFDKLEADFHFLEASGPLKRKL